MRKSIVGLDIGSSYIKMVRLAWDGKEARLLDSYYIKVPHSFNPRNVSDAVKKALDIKKINLHHPICLSLLAEDSFFEIISIASKLKARFKEIIYNELKNNVAFSFEDCIWDYWHLKDNRSEGVDRFLIATAKKEGLLQRFKIIQDAGYAPKLINLDILAAYNCLRFNHDLSPEKLYALLDISPTQTKLLIFDLNGDFWGKLIPFGTQRFLLRIASGCGLTPQEAAEFIKKVPLQEAERLQVEELLWPLVEEFAGTLKNSFDEYHFRSSNAATKKEAVRPIDQIWLSGGGSFFKGIDEMLCNNLGIPVQRVASFKKIGVEKNRQLISKDILHTEAPMFTTAVGLALQGLECAEIRINFIKSSAIDKAKNIIRKIPWRFLSYIFLFVVFVAAIMIVEREFISKPEKNRYIIEKVAAAREYVRQAFIKRGQAKDMVKMWAPITADTSGELLATQNTFSQLFIRISESLPAGIRITATSANFDYQNRRAEVVLYGYASDSGAIQRLVKRLENTNWFISVEPKQSGREARKQEAKGLEHFSIKLDIDLRR